MPQIKPPVPAVPTSRTGGATGAPTRSRTTGICICRGAAAGGQHRATVGVSTKPETAALLDWFEMERKKCIGEVEVRW